jgi:hypothetical protein
MSSITDAADNLLHDLVIELAGELTEYADTPLVEVFGAHTEATWNALGVSTAEELHTLLLNSFHVPAVQGWPSALLDMFTSALRENTLEGPTEGDDPTGAAAHRAHDGLVLVAAERDVDPLKAFGGDEQQ